MPRTERKNDTILMGKLDTIITTQSNQNTEIAVIRTKAEETEKHLSILNSKVATQEARQQATDAAIALNTQSTKILFEDRSANTTTWKTWSDKIVWAIVLIFASLFYKVLVSTNIISNFLK